MGCYIRVTKPTDKVINDGYADEAQCADSVPQPTQNRCFQNH